MLALSGIMGNDALTSVLMLRETGPETGVSALPAGPCMTAPGEWGGGEPITSDAPDFAAFSPLGGAAPLAL